MSQEDNELEKLKAKRLAEMEKNLSSQKQQKELQSSQEEEKKNQPTYREIVVKRLGYRGLEVLQNAEYQFPKETQICVQAVQIRKMAELLQPVPPGSLSGESEGEEVNLEVVENADISS